MSLTVLNVAYPLAPVGPNAVGGAEQVLTRLDTALVQKGYCSLVVACEGSETEGKLFATPRPQGPLTEAVRCSAWKEHRERINQLLLEYHIDVVHLHGIDFIEYLPPAGVPVLVTLHLPPGWYPQQVFRLQRPQTFLNGVSRSQLRACPRCPYLLPEIENGVPGDLFQTRHAKRRFALCLGRICPEKGFHLAVEAAKRADMPLLLAGEVFPYGAHEDYFNLEIRPRLGGGCQFIGPVGWERKRRLLSAARCLLVPSLVPETSSLVAMEALACGTPVIAFPSGALAEIVEHGKTGFLVKDERAMAEAMANVNAISSETCRAAARRRFTLQKMIAKYFEVYRFLADSALGSLTSKEGNGHLC